MIARTLCGGLLLAVGLLALPAAGSTVEAEVTALLAEAIAAPSRDAAEKRIAQAARRLREAGGQLGELTDAFLEAEIKRVRGQVAAVGWLRAGAKPGAVGEKASRALAEALTDLERFQKLAEDRAEAIEKKLGLADPVGNATWREAVAYVSRANYSLAWTDYYLGRLAPAKERDAHLKRGVERFLGFTAEGYRAHPIVADCFLGQALCLFELKRYFPLTQLLEQVKRDQTPRAAYKQMMYLLLKTYQAQSAPAPSLKLETHALPYFDGLPADHKLDGVEIDMALLRARNLDALAKAMPDYAATFQQRLDGVARLVFSYGEPWASRLAKAIGRSPGGKPFVCLMKAREHFLAKRYAEAAAEAARGLAGADAKSGEAVLADLRHTRAAALWNLKRWREAHAAAADFIRHHASDRRAADLCGRAFVAALKARKAKPPLPDTDFLRFLDLAEARFPAHPAVRRAPWHRASLLLDAGETAKARRALERVAPGSPIYPHAQYGLALAAHRELEAAPEKQQAPLLARATAAMLRCLEALPSKATEEDRAIALAAARLGLALTQRLLASGGKAPQSAGQLLDRLAPLQALDPTLDAEHRGLRIEALVATGQTAEALRRIERELTRGKLDPPVAQALTRITDPLEREQERLAKAGKATEAQPLAGQLARIYDALRRETGPDRQRHLALRRRHASALARAGSHREAVRQYEWLRSRVPRESSGDVLRGLGTSYEALRNYDAAVDAWRTLSKGLEARSEPWLEARCRLIRCQLKAGRRDHARRLLDYLRLQCPDLDAGPWGAKLKELDAALSAKP